MWWGFVCGLYFVYFCYKFFCTNHAITERKAWKGEKCWTIKGNCENNQQPEILTELGFKARS